MPLPHDYEERVYAGVLGKIIGVYLGRPFEGWGYDAIMERLGEVNYYVHERLNAPLIVTDDDITGTFTFLRALPDHGNRPDLTAREVGETWLNTLIERQTILWWGGMGNSTEHTAYYRLKSGVPAPQSGSIALNGATVAEQIGAQIFIDGWAMVAPGDPERAVYLAGEATRVSHDGEAVYGAQVLAAMEAQAFVENDLNRLLDTAAALIPRDSTIYRLIADLREWRAADSDWRQTRERIVARYGYDKFGGNCHIVPNHALILLGLLWCDDDFQRALMITNTSGWDTDCNSGNVGCLMGIKNGLAGLETGPDWRGPVADRIFLPTADGGRCITDAVQQTRFVCGIGRALANAPVHPHPHGARYAFEFPGSVQGFQIEDSPESKGAATLDNVALDTAAGTRALAVRYRSLATGRAARAGTRTFILPEDLKMGGYSLIASPTLYPGQTVTGRVSADASNPQPVTVCLYQRVYGENDRLEVRRSASTRLDASMSATLEWRPTEPSGPIAEVGVEVTSPVRTDGAVLLESLTWSDTPEVTLAEPPTKGEMWKRAWVRGCDNADMWGQNLRLMQDAGNGIGLLSQGDMNWRDYTVSATVTPRLMTLGGVAACVQGLRRWVGLLLTDDGRVKLMKAADGLHTLAEAALEWRLDEAYDLSLTTRGGRYTARVNGAVVLEAEDTDAPLVTGGVGLLVEAGRLDSGPVVVTPALP